MRPTSHAAGAALLSFQPPETDPMLSPEHRAIVQATVPLLETGGEALTTHFYIFMLSE